MNTKKEVPAHNAEDYTYKAIRLDFEMPKAQFSSFNGAPTEYWSFMNNFDVNIARKLLDDASRLSYLIQFCSGKAKQSIESCVLMGADGYRKAREILATQFGQPHVIMHALMKDVMNRSPLKPNDSVSLWDLVRSMKRCEITLNQMGYVSDLNSTDNILKVQSLLPIYLQSKWAKKAQDLIQRKGEPTFTDLTEFLEGVAQVSSNMYGQNVGKFEKKSRAKVTSLATQAAITNKYSGKSWSTSPQRTCPSCSKEHKINNCNSFMQMPYLERLKLARTKKLCDNCLLPYHIARLCRHKGNCEKCDGKHHTLLHSPNLKTNEGNNKELPNKKTEVKQNDTADGVSCATSASARVCLRILAVKVRVNGVEMETYALLDNGSDVTLCDERLADKLKLTGKKRAFTITTVNGTESQRTGNESSMVVKDITGKTSIDLSKVWTVSKLPVSYDSIPRIEDTRSWPHLKDVKLPSINDKEVMLLIGGDVPEAFWVLEERRGNRKEPYAIRSLLGWTIMGPAVMGEPSTKASVHLIQHQDPLQRQVEKFWTTDFGDSITDESTGESLEDKRAKNIMNETITMKNGHYEIGLPWRYDAPYLPDNLYLAENRLHGLKRRLQKDSTLHEKYKDTMEAYIEKGYAEKIGSAETSSISSAVSWYLPHHPVVNPLKPEKLRVVFDCAAKCKGTSLNQQLLQGPDHTNNLIGVLMRFRCENIVLIADVEAMFHQVRVPLNDRGALKFLWWPGGDYTVDREVYHMNVHLFGATSSPSCAGFALRKTAEDNRAGYSEDVINTVYNNFYVDECLKSVSTREEAIILVEQLRSLLRKGGFRLHKWSSNDREVLSSIPETERTPSIVDMDLDKLPVQRTLGVLWNAESDNFGFKVCVKQRPTTRRGILSKISSLYDPLGFVAPYVIPAKVLLQNICRRGMDWDEDVGGKELFEWQQWLEDLPRFSAISIPRAMRPKEFGNVTSCIISVMHQKGLMQQCLISEWKLMKEECIVRLSVERHDFAH